MRNLNEVLTLTNDNELQKEIKKRQELIKKMVGNLYPQVVMDEIIAIKKHIATLVVKTKGAY